MVEFLYVVTWLVLKESMFRVGFRVVGVEGFGRGWGFRV